MAARGADIGAEIMLVSLRQLVLAAFHCVLPIILVGCGKIRIAQRGFDHRDPRGAEERYSRFKPSRPATLYASAIVG